ncbi:MAG: gliding motility-associated C-terminal domain-containing protein [Saprospiraceae bacterium]
MKTAFRGLSFLFVFPVISFSIAQTQTPPAAALAEKMQAADILFLENKGQIRGPRGEARPDMLFLAKGQGCKVLVTANGLSYQFEKTEYPEGYQPRNRRDIDRTKQQELEKQIRRSTHRVDMRLAGANPNPTIHREQAAAYYENYYNIPEAPEGILGVRSYEKLRVEQVYPGIDWLLYSKGQGLKYDFIVQPGADPALIRMDYSWADALKLNPDGSLSIVTPLGELTEAAPVCFQGDQKIPAQFVLDGNTVSIAPEAYDRQQPLVIDPCVVWGTYYGGPAFEFESVTATDAAGHVYLAGYTASMSDIAAGGHQNTLGGNSDAFLVQFDASGVRQWGTYYGGSEFDWATALATDGLGHVYLAGVAGSSSAIAFGGHQNIIGGNGDAFLVQFDAAGVRQWGTYYGGSEDEYCFSVATDGLGHVYLAGDTGSSDGIAFDGYQDNYGGKGDAFLVQFDAAGVRQWGTYYGGSEYDWGGALSIDGLGHVYMAGGTSSSDGIAFGGHQNMYGGDGDAYLVQFDAAGMRQWGTYYGGSADEDGNSLATDGQGHVYMAGNTASSDGIALGGHQNSYGGGTDDAFLVQFDAAGVRQWGTYYGSSERDFGFSVATDGQGLVYLAGRTHSGDGIAFGGHQNMYGGDGDAYLVQFDATGVRQWGTYYGGSDYDYGYSVATDGQGYVYLAGIANSTGGIAFGGHQNANNGAGDAFLVKMYPADLELSETITPITCKLLSDGSIELETANGPAGVTYNYSWSNGATTPDVSNLAEGAYTVTVSYGAACSTVNSYTVPGPPNFVSSSSNRTHTCFNQQKGVARITAFGGWGDFTYLWSNGETTSVISNLPAGTYTVTFTDQGGCSNTNSMTINAIGGGPVSFSTVNQQLVSGEALSITMDGMGNADWFAWFAGQQSNIQALQPDNGIWSTLDGAFTKIVDVQTPRSFGKVEIGVTPEYFADCYGDTVWFAYNLVPGQSGVFIPEIYTPNGDGQTDTWAIILPPDFQNARVTVYNRAGAKVYEGDATMPWDGSNAPDGTYFYVLNYTLFGQQHTLKGAVTILRTN